MMEDLDHDRGEREARESIDKPLPYPIRFGTNPNMMDAWRKQQEERRKKKEGKE
jgi:hypothetical protein